MVSLKQKPLADTALCCVVLWCCILLHSSYHCFAPYRKVKPLWELLIPPHFIRRFRVQTSFQLDWIGWRFIIKNNLNFFIPRGKKLLLVFWRHCILLGYIVLRLNENWAVRATYVVGTTLYKTKTMSIFIWFLLIHSLEGTHLLAVSSFAMVVIH